jgi:hypothetical protein
MPREAVGVSMRHEWDTATGGRPALRRDSRCLIRNVDRVTGLGFDPSGYRVRADFFVLALLADRR